MYRVSNRVIETRVEVWENEKCCGNSNRRRVFPQLFRVLPNFQECFYLTNRLRARDFYEVIVDSDFGLTNYHLTEIESESFVLVEF